MIGALYQAARTRTLRRGLCIMSHLQRCVATLMPLHMPRLRRALMVPAALGARICC